MNIYNGFAPLQFGNQSRNDYNKILNILIDALSQMKHKEYFEILGCCSLNLQLKDNVPRQTKDIDLTISIIDAWNEIIDTICVIANELQDDYNFEIMKRRGFDKNPHSDSIVFNIINNKTKINITDVKIDMNIRQLSSHPMISRGFLKFTNIKILLCNKLRVACSKKLYRRIKDLIDIYVILQDINSGYLKIDYQELQNQYKELYPDLLPPTEDLILFDSTSFPILQHAYEKYKGIDLKDISFEEIYKVSYEFIQQFFLSLMWVE